MQVRCAVCLLSIVVLAAGCLDLGSEDQYDRVPDVAVDITECPPNLSYATDLAPTLAATCAVSFCHDSETAMLGLVLEEDVAYDNLLTGSSAIASKDYVVALDVDASYLFDRVAAQNGATPMPPSGDPLSAETIGLIGCWIDAGAPE